MHRDVTAVKTPRRGVSTGRMRVSFEKMVVILLAAAFLIFSSIYWQDPWLWRNYVRFFSTGTATAVELLPPDEEIRGDQSFNLSVAEPDERTISAEAFDAMHDYAREFGSHALITVHRGEIQDEWYAEHWQRDLLT